MLVKPLSEEAGKEQKMISLAWGQLGKFAQVKLFADVSIAPTVSRRAVYEALLWGQLQTACRMRAVI